MLTFIDMLRSGMEQGTRPTHINEKADFQKEISVSFLGPLCITVAVAFIFVFLSSSLEFDLSDFTQAYGIAGVCVATIWTLIRINGPFRPNRAVYIGVGAFVAASLLCFILLLIFSA